MSKIRWFDRNGVEIFEGDTVRDVDTGKEELVYECHPQDYPEDTSLGLNASNEKWLENHPTWPREIYPFTNFAHTMSGAGECTLCDYEKVV